jgi:hypothetical protein
MVEKSVKEWLAEIGRKGGKAGGKSKARGGSEYYRKLRAKGIKKQRKGKL